MKPFNWKDLKQKAIDKKLQRAIHEARTNPDYQVAHPTEVKSNPERKVLPKCHPDAEKRILQEMKQLQQRAEQPIVERPVRVNRLG